MSELYFADVVNYDVDDGDMVEAVDLRLEVSDIESDAPGVVNEKLIEVIRRSLNYGSYSQPLSEAQVRDVKRVAEMHRKLVVDILDAVKKFEKSQGVASPTEH